MKWIGEVGNAKSLDELSDFCIHYWQDCATQETVKDPCVQKQSEALKKGGYLAGRQIACLIYKKFGTRGESEDILDFGDSLKVELKNDKLPASDTKVYQP